MSKQITSGNGINVAWSGTTATVSNNAAPMAPLDLLSAATRALVLANTDYSANYAAAAEVTAALSACMGHSCYLPPGSYYISRPLVMLPVTKILGAGRHLTFIRGTANMTSAPLFTCTDAYVHNLNIEGATIGGANCASAFDFSPAITHNAPYASVFKDLLLQGGTSHGYIENHLGASNSNAFQNSYTSVAFSSLGAGDGAHVSGNHEDFIDCSAGPLGSNDSIGIVSASGGTFINFDGLSSSGGYAPNVQPAIVFALGQTSPQVQPHATFIGCNFEYWGVTAIALRHTPIGITIRDCGFNPNTNRPIRSYIDDIGAASVGYSTSWGLTLENPTLEIPKAGFNTSQNVASVALMTGATISANPRNIWYKKVSVSDVASVTFGSTDGVRTWSIFSQSPRQLTAAVLPGYGRAASAQVDMVHWAPYAFVNQLNVAGSNSPSVLAAGTTTITLPSGTLPTSRRTYFKTANTAPTTIIDVLGDTYAHTEGTFLWLSIGDTFTTIAHNGAGSWMKFSLTSGANEVALLGAVYMFMYSTTTSTWRQVSYSKAASGGSGTVTSVTGTTNQVCVATGTTTPVLSICPAFSWSGTTYAASTSTSWGSSSSSGPDGTQVYLLPDNGKLSWTDNVNFGVEATVTVKRQLSGTDGEIQLLATGLSGQRTFLEVAPQGAQLQWQSISGTSTTAEPNVRTAVTVKDGQLQLICNDGGAGDDGVVTLTDDDLESTVPIHAPYFISVADLPTPTATGWTTAAGTGVISHTILGTRDVLLLSFTTGPDTVAPPGGAGTLLVTITGLGPYPNRVICSVEAILVVDGITWSTINSAASGSQIDIRLTSSSAVPGATLAPATNYGFYLLCKGY